MNKTEIQEALDVLWEYFDQREDIIDVDYGRGPCPNKEMKLKQLVEKMQEACISKP